MKIKDGRDHFKILEGKLKGKIMSVRKKSKTHSYLLDNIYHEQAAELIFEQEGKLLIVKGLGTYSNIAMKTSNLIPFGTYDLELPWEIHPIARRYSGYAMTWFRIGNEGDRFLHTGSVSLGCITVKDTEKWTEIYNFLIRRRKDNSSVGTIRIE